MKYIIKIPFIFILYILRLFGSTCVFIGKVLSNIFEKKCNNEIDDIVAITYYSEELPSIIGFTLYYDEKYFPKNIKLLKTDPKVSKKEFAYILDVIDKNKIMQMKKYILNCPYVSPLEYYSYYFAVDAGPTTQSLTMHFKNGDSKYITGYSKELDNLREALEDILPGKLFW